ncbi:coiled-coil domain-containing protein [Thiocystis violascens]|nr:coiled-coil domain-containing protein [Thiocystis violascens]
MSAALQLYEQLTEAPDDKTRARLIAEAFDVLEARFPQIGDLATQGHVRESELRLLKEIEQVRAALRESELRLRKEIEQVRNELRESELRLQKEIEQIRAELKLDIAQLRAEVERMKTDLLKWIVPLMFAQVAAIAALVKLL